MAKAKRQSKKHDSEELTAAPVSAELSEILPADNLPEAVAEEKAADEAAPAIDPTEAALAAVLPVENSEEIPTSLEALAQLGAAQEVPAAGEPEEEPLPAFVFPEGSGSEALAKLGPALQARRLELGITFADITHRTCIAQSTIVAMETQPLDKLDAPFYIKNRLALYARVLGIDAKAMQDFFDACVSPTQEQVSQERHNNSTKRWLIVVLVTVVLAAIAVIISINK